MRAHRSVAYTIDNVVAKRVLGFCRDGAMHVYGEPRSEGSGDSHPPRNTVPQNWRTPSKVVIEVTRQPRQ
jgi:hypothetical protein